MQARCQKNGCEHWNFVDSLSPQLCMYCGAKYTTNIYLLIEQQWKATAKYYAWIKQISFIGTIILSLTFISGNYLHLISISAAGYIYLICGLLYLVISIVAHKNIKKQFPEIYNNPNWKP